MVDELLIDSSASKNLVREILTLAKRGYGPLFLPSNWTRVNRESHCAGKDGNFMDREVASTRYEDARLARLEACHALAQEGRLKEMKSILRQMLHEEG